MATRSGTQRRRSSDEVRSLILDAARAEFIAKGYDGASVREIAGRAGVSQALLFTNFQNKANLFAAAVTSPFTELIAQYSDLWESDEPTLTTEVRIRVVVDGLYTLVQQNRALLLSGVMRQTTNGHVPETDVLDDIARLFQGMQDSPSIMRAGKTFGIDIPAGIAASIGMILGVALLDALIFPSGTRRPSQARLVNEMSAMIEAYAVRSRQEP